MIRFAVLLLVLCAPQPVLAQGDCDRPGRVTLTGSRIPIRTALRSLAEQTGYDIAISKSVRGSVTANLRCAEFHTALRELVTQVGAVYCETERGIVVSDPGEAPCERREPSVQSVSCRITHYATRSRTPSVA